MLRWPWEFIFFWIEKEAFCYNFEGQVLIKGIFISFRKSLNYSKLGDLKSRQTRTWGRFRRKFSTAASAKIVLWRSQRLGCLLKCKNQSIKQATSTHHTPPAFIWSVGRNLISGSRAKHIWPNLSEGKYLLNIHQQLQISKLKDSVK